MSQWFYMNGGNSTGPITKDDLAKLVKTNRLNADSLVWREGFHNWTTIRSVTELQSLIDSTAKQSNTNPSLPPPPPLPITEMARTPIPAATRANGWPWINLILPGVAQIIYGQPGKGAIMLVALYMFDELIQQGESLGLLLTLALVVGSIIDAFSLRKVLHQGRKVEPWAFFPS